MLLSCTQADDMEELLNVDVFEEPEFQPDMIDKLVMDPTRINTLKALASSYIRENKDGVKTDQPPWNADFVPGKGQGQIILLHGKPGSGKTCTAGKCSPS
jgi:Cdc6-like AAA superfamily ATPase